jgi:putative ABC transport system substrate-binding protein
LKGGRPENLPVQEATTYETVSNLKTAKALNIVVSAQLLARAGEVIE